MKVSVMVWRNLQKIEMNFKKIDRDAMMLSAAGVLVVGGLVLIGGQMPFFIVIAAVTRCVFGCIENFVDSASGKFVSTALAIILMVFTVSVFDEDAERHLVLLNLFLGLSLPSMLTSEIEDNMKSRRK